MRLTSKNSNFIQDPKYAVNFDIYRKLLSKLLDHDPSMFELDKKARIVDIGCGYGDLLKTLRARSYKKLIGIEPDPICRASCLNEGLDVREGIITKTGLPNKFADAVIVNEVFHHISNFDGALDELVRILTPNGLLCFIEPLPTFLRQTMDILTFQTPLLKLINPVKVRYDVMKMEMETGLYPRFLKHQAQFYDAINRRFSQVWLHRGWFFQFGKYKKL